MDEFFKALRHFITRDLVFLTGGGIVVGSFLHLFEDLRPNSGDHLVVFLLLVGISYVVGYAIQDGFSLTGLVSTVLPKKLVGIQKRLYEKFTGLPWKDINGEIDFEEVESSINDDRKIALYERIITLKQVGTTVGPCSLVVAFFLANIYFRKERKEDLWLALFAGALGLLLIGLGWIKLGQQAKFLERVCEKKPNT